MTAQRKSRNCAFSSGVSPESKRLMPVSVDMDQLLCLPEPFTPSKGFSCSRQTRPCFLARLLHDVHDELVVVGGDVGRGVDAGELVLGGGDLVVLGLGGTPSFQSSSSSSRMKAATRGLMVPK